MMKLEPRILLGDRLSSLGIFQLDKQLPVQVQLDLENAAPDPFQRHIPFFA